MRVGAVRACARGAEARSARDRSRRRQLEHQRRARWRRFASGQRYGGDRAALYQAKCLACHGEKGAGKPSDQLAGGQGTLRDANAVRTVGSYWPYATTLFDYIRRAMPYVAPQSLTPDELYSLSAYILYLNGVIAENDEMNAASFRK